jgi:hypothetical protein
VRKTLLILALLGLCAPVAAAEPALTVEFGAKGGVCMSDADRSALTERLKTMVLPQGAAITLVAYSSRDERKAKGKAAKCLKRVVPNGIKGDQRLAVMRALFVSELATELGLSAFDNTPLLLIGAGAGYRQTDPAGTAIVARRSQGSSESDRRVEVWFTEAGARPSGEANYGAVMAPVLLPPMAYGGGGSAEPVPSSGGSTADPVLTASDPGPGTQELLGWTFLGLGLTAVVGGAVSYQQSTGLSDRAAEVAFDRRQETAFNDDADLYEQVAYWSGGLGIGLATLGIVLVATAPDDTTVAIVPSPFGDGAIVQFGSNLPAWSWR